MSFVERLKNGWKIGWISLDIIRDNPALLLFVLMSGTSIILILLSFLSTILVAVGISEFANIALWFSEFEGNEILSALTLFFFYLIAFFTAIFFNIGLVYCTRQVFQGETVSIKEGLAYSVQKINVTLAWAALAATVGTLLKMLEERLGFIGQLVIGLIGMVWSLATFFVVPILAFENIGPVDALKRSAMMMKKQWGEAIGANFSFVAFYLLGYLAAIAYAVIMFMFHPLVAIIGAMVIILLAHTAVSSAKTVFVTAAYQHLEGQSGGRFDEHAVLDRLFVPKKSKQRY